MLNKKIQTLIQEYLDADRHPEEMFGYECIIEGNWIRGAGYDYRRSVVKNSDTGDYFRISQIRNGSPEEGFAYESPDVRQVQPKQKTVTVYE